MNNKSAEDTRVRYSKRMEQKLQERSAVLYMRELERWNTRRIGPAR
jgi:hypothetical protein